MILLQHTKSFTRVNDIRLELLKSIGSVEDILSRVADRTICQHDIYPLIVLWY